jgi:hypothetical protein
MAELPSPAPPLAAGGYGWLAALAGFVPLVQVDPQTWEPGIGDPTVLGWLTVVAYFYAAWLCLQAYRSARSLRAPGRLTAAWSLLTLLMIALGFNKQLDLQTLLTVVARRWALRGGWYERRRTVQVEFIETLAVCGVAALTAGAWLMRRHLREIGLAGFGAIFIVVFVLVRAASFHHVDSFLHAGPGGLRMNWILELGGIALIGVGALRFLGLQRRRSSARGAGPRT